MGDLGGSPPVHENTIGTFTKADHVYRQHYKKHRQPLQQFMHFLVTRTPYEHLPNQRQYFQPRKRRGHRKREHGHVEFVHFVAPLPNSPHIHGMLEAAFPRLSAFGIRLNVGSYAVNLYINPLMSVA